MMSFAPGTRIGRAVSFHSFRFPSFRLFASQHWRCFHGYGLVNVSPPFLLESSGTFSRERTGCLRSTVFTESRQFHATSSRNGDNQKSRWKQPEPDRKARTLAILTNEKIIALGKDGRWREILILYHKEKYTINAINSSTVMSQLARIRQTRQDDPLFKLFLAHISTSIDEGGIKWLGDVRQLSNIVHAMAKMGLDLRLNSSANQIMTFMANSETVEWMFAKGTPQNITNSVWACGKLGVVAPNLFKALDEQVDWVIDGGTQGIANCAWACATLRIEAPNLFEKLNDQAQWLFEHGNPQVIANCLWACGKLGIKAPELFKLLDQRAEWLFEEAKAPEIASCVVACAKLGINAPKLFQLLDQRASWFAKNGSLQDVGVCVWAYDQLGIKPPKLFVSRRFR